MDVGVGLGVVWWGRMMMMPAASKVLRWTALLTTTQPLPRYPLHVQALLLCVVVVVWL